MGPLPKFFVAIDAANPSGIFEALDKISIVKGDYGIKLNLDSVIKDASIIKRVVEQTCRPIFVDLKMWNGARTMTEVVKFIADQGAYMINMYALADNMLEEAVSVAKDAGLIVLGVTVLTHYDERYCKKFHKMSMSELVRLLAETALKRGCDGYILPGTALKAVRDLQGIKFNPAIRPAGFENKGANFQKQLMTAREAFEGGSSIVSCNSPIFKSDFPAQSLESILQEITDATMAGLPPNGIFAPACAGRSF